MVALIKDLNGNHVVQKCLHKLSAEHNQFIYDIVSRNCIQVASHKHGCCVYQRCIDRATLSQKVWKKIFYKKKKLFMILCFIESTCKCNYTKCFTTCTRSIWKLCCTICIRIRRSCIFR